MLVCAWLTVMILKMSYLSFKFEFEFKIKRQKTDKHKTAPLPVKDDVLHLTEERKTRKWMTEE